MRKSGKNRNLFIINEEKKEVVKPRIDSRIDYSLKKSSRGAKLRKIYESNIQLNKQMVEDMKEFEILRQYLLQDDDDEDEDNNNDNDKKKETLKDGI